MDFFFLCFSGEREPSADRTRHAHGLEREKKVVSTLSRVSFIALTWHLFLLARKIKKKQNETKQTRQLKKHVCSRCKIEESNYHLCLRLSQGILKSIVLVGHVYFETEIEQY